MFEQLGLIGCGLMGGSFALALKRAGLVQRVVGYSKSPATTRKRPPMGVIDVEAPSALLAATGADIVLVAVPVAATEATLQGDPAPGHAADADHGRGLHQARCGGAAQRALGEQIGSFVPAHPIAGKEMAGVEHADAELYQGCQVILTPIEPTPSTASCSRRSTSGSALGCRVAEHVARGRMTPPLPPSATCRTCWRLP